MNRKRALAIMKTTKNTYNLIGSEFSDTRDRIWPEMEELVNKYVKKGDKVLDVGCGNGRLLEVLPKVEYLGVDASDELIAQSKKKLRIKPAPLRLAGPGNYELRIEKIDFKKLDILELNKLDGEFDIVFCFASFNHIAGKEFKLKVLNDIRNLLKPGGLLIMTNWNMWQWGVKKNIWKSKKIGLKDVMTTWKSGDGKKSGEIYYRVFTRGELKRLLRRSGFKVLENYISKNRRNIVTVGRK